MSRSTVSIEGELRSIGVVAGEPLARASVVDHVVGRRTAASVVGLDVSDEQIEVTDVSAKSSDEATMMPFAWVPGVATVHVVSDSGGTT